MLCNFLCHVCIHSCFVASCCAQMMKVYRPKTFYYMFCCAKLINIQLFYYILMSLYSIVFPNFCKKLFPLKRICCCRGSHKNFSTGYTYMRTAYGAQRANKYGVFMDLSIVFGIQLLERFCHVNMAVKHKAEWLSCWTCWRSPACMSSFLKKIESWNRAWSNQRIMPITTATYSMYWLSLIW